MSDYEIKAISTRGGIEGKHILQRSADAAKTWVAHNRRPEKSTTRLERTGLLAKFSAGVCRSILGRMIDLEQRLAAIEGVHVHRSLDVEAIEEVAGIAERLERLERSVSEMEDHGFRYRGYWRDGLKAKRGDAFTHDGSLWYASRATNDRPCNESADWAVVARKGRDAR